MKYLDLTGLSEVWANIKSYISSKIPTKTSQLQNDSNYVTTSQLPSKTSQLTNDSDFTTNAKLTSKANDSDVVHKSGDETISGVKGFNGVFLGEQDGVIRIGQNFEGALFCNLYYDGGIYNNIKLFYPKTDNEYYLGTPSNKWKDIYATTFSCLSTIDKATTNTSWSIYRPFRIVDKDNSIELGLVEYGYKSDLAYIRLFSNHNTSGASDLTILNNGISYFDNCKELWLINKNLDSYNTTPSNEIDTQIWFTDKNSNKYATLQTDYYADGARHFALTHKSLRTDTWIGLNMITSPTDDVIRCQPRFQVQDGLLVQNTDANKFTHILQGWIEMSSPDYSGIDFKHASSQDYLGRIALSPDNILYLETINGAPIMANGKNIVRSINGVYADSNGNVSIQGVSDGRNIVRSVNGVNADSNGNVNIQGVSDGIGEIIQGYYVPNGIVQKSGSVYFGTLVQPDPGTPLSDFRDINITITDEFQPEAGKIYDYSQIFSTLYLHSYDSEYAANDSFYCGSSPKVDKWLGGWAKVAGSNLVRNSGRYLCTSVSPYGYAVTLRYNLVMTCEMSSHPEGSSPNYSCKIVSKTVPQNQMTVTSKATFTRVG